jgi:hypothetical protein
MTYCPITRQYVFFVVSWILQRSIGPYSPHVRQRAILACRSLSRHEAEVMGRVSGVLLKRIQDPQPMVANAAHIAVSDLLKVCLIHVNVLSQRLTVLSGLPVVSGPSR